MLLRRWLVSLLFLSSLLLGLTACQPSSNAPVFHDNRGNLIEFSHFKGQWVVLNYWASWCKPCWAEIPELNAFYQAHQKQQDVVVLGVSYDPSDQANLATLIKKMGITYPVLQEDPASSLGITDIPGLPVTYVITPDGKLLPPLYGPQTQQSLAKAIQGQAGKPT